MRAIASLLDRLYRVCGLLAALALVALTGLVFASIATRLLGVFIGGLTEYAGYTMAAGSFFALAYAFREGAHIRVELLISHLGPGARRGAEVFCLGVMSVVSVYLAWFLGKLAYVSYDFGDISEGGDALPLWIPQVPVAVGSTIFAIACIHSLIEVLFDPDAEPTRGGSEV